jgi:alpha-tubulin suppressor-like RCC1 family protein
MLPDVKKDGDADGMLEVECWRQFACGTEHTAAVTPEGDLYTWGDSDSGQLGHGDQVGVDRPKLVTSGLICKNVVHVTCGDRHTVVITGHGDLFTW